MKFWAELRLVFMVSLLASCASLESSSQMGNDPFSPRLREAREVSNSQEKSAVTNAVEMKAKVKAAPSLTLGKNSSEVELDKLGSNLVGGSLSVNVNDLPVSYFINEVFGEQLGLSFSVDPTVQRLTDLVTLRLAGTVSHKELFAIARRTLASYGIAITQEEGVYSFKIDNDVSTGALPIIISGGALPEVPASHRPIFMFVPLKAVSSLSIHTWLSKAFRGNGLRIESIPVGNSILLQGKPELIREALAMIEVLDQPLMRGMNSMIVEPAYTSVSSLARDVVKILKVEGFDATVNPPVGGVILLPLSESNQIVVFANDRATLGHVQEWILALDKKHVAESDNGIFSYQVNHGSATELIKILESLESGDKDKAAGHNYVADTSRNVVLYKGSGVEWTKLLPILKDMDKPAASVLVEVLLIEVTLTDSESTGFEFIAKSGDVTFSTLGRLGIGGSGLGATLDRAGETRAILNVFAESKRVNIRSRPRILVKSGRSASIDVGTEIPIITSSSQSTNDAAAPIIQNIQYRKTGVLLEITPIVHSSGFVDIEIKQELSEAQSTSTSAIDSPSIFNRKIRTTVTLKDGGSVLLGGLIAESISGGNKGVPILKDVPLLGRLFKAKSETRVRTELMMLIIPYVIDTPSEAISITNSAFELIDATLWKDK